MKTLPEQHSNPAFAGSTGVEANHSSSELPTEHAVEASHAQFDEAINDIPVSQDPNISGNAPTADLHPYDSGRLQGWQDNDSYMHFFMRGEAPESALYCRPQPRDMINDNDFDDNGGIPIRGGSAVGGDIADTQIGSTAVNITILRRV